MEPTGQNHNPPSGEEAIAHDKANMASVRIYSDGSSIDGGVGAAAVLYINNSMRRSLQYHLGSDKHHTVYEAELVARKDLNKVSLRTCLGTCPHTL